MVFFNYRILSLFNILTKEGVNYATPITLNYGWSFGAFAGIFLAIQILTGLFLAMHYNSDVSLAFLSVEHIMRDVPYGWLIRYLHANGASFFFIALYFHMARGLYYGSFLGKKYKVWATGLVLFLLVMATAFLGYVLPFGQMSLWGATVITNLFSIIPVYGPSLTTFIWGGFTVGGPTISRFYALHFVLPFVVLAITLVHIYLLHTEGSSSPQGTFVKHSLFSTFYPFFYVKDKFVFWIIMSVYGFVVFFIPNYLGHPDNYIPANPLNTPAHIVPEWYFLAFYAILRSVPSKAGGVILMFSAILILFLLPLLNTTPKYINLANYNTYKILVLFWATNFIILSYVGGLPVESPYVEIGRLATVVYFGLLVVAYPAMGIVMWPEEWKQKYSKFRKDAIFYFNYFVKK